MCHFEGILERSTDCIVPIHGNATEMENGGSGKVDVHRIPDVTQNFPPEPST